MVLKVERRRTLVEGGRLIQNRRVPEVKIGSPRWLSRCGWPRVIFRRAV